MMAFMAARQQSTPISEVVAALQREVKRQGLTSYRLAKETVLRIDTMQRLLAGKGSPTISTLESVANALGMVIEAKHRA